MKRNHSNQPAEHPIEQTENNTVSSSHISINPLEQSVVAEIVLQFISRDLISLRSFRLVCQTWRAVCQTSWNHLHGTLTIYPPDQPINPPFALNTNKSYQLNQFYQRYTNPKDNLFKYPFQNYDLRFWKLQLSHFVEQEHCTDLSTWFWSTFAPLRITNLTLSSSNTLGTFTIFSEEFLRALPNLNSLNIVGGTFTPEAFEVIHHRYESQIRYFEHINLKKIYLEVFVPNEQLKVLWCVFQRSLPNLESLKVRRLCDELQPDHFRLSDFTSRIITHRSALVPLRTLDFIEYTSDNPDHHSLKNLPLPNPQMISSFPNTFQVFTVSIENGQSETGGMLEIFVCPVVEPVRGILSKFRTLNLNEIRLWGNVYSSLDFLGDGRQLRVLIWKGSCWENREHRRKVLVYLREGKGEEGEWRHRNSNDLAVIGRKIVRRETEGERENGVLSYCGSINNNVVNDVIVARNLRRLEIDFRWGVGGWRGLGRVLRMTELRELKGVVMGDQQLREVGDTWGQQLERLKFGHGSGGFSKSVFMEVVLGKDKMPSLMEFRWSRCPCLTVEITKNNEWGEVEEGLRAKLGRLNFTLPYLTLSDEGESLQGICLEAEYDKALETGRIAESLIEMMWEF